MARQKRERVRRRCERVRRERIAYMLYVMAMQMD
jgi:hypothetical protein